MKLKRDQLEALALASIDSVGDVMLVLDEVRTGREPVDVWVCGAEDDCVEITQDAAQEIKHRIWIDKKLLPEFLKTLQAAVRDLGFEMNFRKLTKKARNT